MVVNRKRAYKAVVIGVSAGGLAALDAILPRLKQDLALSVFVVQHIRPDSDDYLARHFDLRCHLQVLEAEDKAKAVVGTVYFAPPNYHLMIELDHTMSLSTQERVQYSRPSIDVLFETAAEAYCDGLVGVVLTGANADGAAGLSKIKSLGGLTIVQDPKTAESDAMPRAALGATEVDHVLPLDGIADLINSL